MSVEVTIEQLESLIYRDQPEEEVSPKKKNKKNKKKKKSKKGEGGLKSLDTDLSHLTAAMFGIAGTIGANEEVR